ncbi:TonB-dependent receptor [Novosphingobium sp. KACC 22771]|uniref:TonB-dependent receptor n=1 Tax=Novosphingobium sp. KACC 22771 TaxID=3025670 RepID=UPI002365C917|nr:TonB-dependent receptor plug domain-containing protein [Novosphingobium sp. KACC 22771]WDF71697.1 TonB-dependent receptor plug domain-containing protein [Novosphingobium sp. KACC 22771]
MGRITFHANLMRSSLSLAAVSLALASAPAFAAAPALAAAVPAADAEAPAADPGETIVVNAKTTRSATAIPAVEMQKILPGISPLKAIQSLPGVLYVTADPWGNNEQNAQMFVHGFSAQQLGYTMDGVPLGDQSYGNYNGLSPSRALISENTGRTVVATGAGELGVASISNLGGAVEITSRDPSNERGLEMNHTAGSYGTARTFVRVDSGEFGNGNKLFLSGSRQRARAWDFAGVQGGYQANGKFIHEDSHGKLTAYFAYSDKIEPNEDATTIYTNPANAVQAYQPYTRPFTYPSLSAALNYLDASGNVPAVAANNYRNYYSDAQRTDYLGYIKYDVNLSKAVKWSNQFYIHHNDGVGVVAGPITVAGLPSLFAKYFPGQDLKTVFGGSGYAIRTTEYMIHREGIISNLNIDAGDHRIEAGVWFHHNESSAYRRWYPMNVNTPDSYSPYIRPSGYLITQYAVEMRTDNLQLHIQDAWRVNDRLNVEAGIKTSAQFANGIFTVQEINNPRPSGRINSTNWFLPSLGANYDLNGSEKVYFNIQKNLRQFQAYGAGGSADPWSTGSQAAFDYIKSNVRPETAWVYEVGLRSHRNFTGLLSSIDAQINYYHVDFSNRLLALSTSGAINTINPSTTALFNVGSVTTNGVDAAITLGFGQHVKLYNALSYNSSKYSSDYSTVTGAATGTQIGGFATVAGVVPTGGKQIPGSPNWMNKTMLTANYAGAEVQLIGDYIGRRYATYTNDASIPSLFLASARIAYQLPAGLVHAKKAELSLNVTNLFDKKGWLQVSSFNNAGSYAAYPVAPRQFFVTLAVGL